MRIAFIISTLIFVSSCANPVSPIGGEKDTTAPVLIRMDQTLLERKDTQLQRWTFVFDENMQSKGAVLLNPSETYLEQRAVVHRNEVTYEVPIGVKQLSLGKTLSDLNEGNLYRPLDSNSLQILVAFKDAKTLRNAKGQWVLKLKCTDETHWVLPSETTPIGLTFSYGDPSPQESKTFFFFLDANANKQYDSSEVYGKGNLTPETQESTAFEYPAFLSNKDSVYSKPVDSLLTELIIKGPTAFYFKEPKGYTEIQKGNVKDSITLSIQEGSYTLFTYTDENQNGRLDWPEPYEIQEISCKRRLINEIIVKKEENTVDFVEDILR